MKDRMVTALLNGQSHTSRPFSQILEALWQRAIGTGFRKGDETAPTNGYFFTPGRSSQEHAHAHPAMAAWSCELIQELVRKESDAMISKEAGLHVRARQKAKERRGSKRTTAVTQRLHDQSVAVGGHRDEELDTTPNGGDTILGTDIGQVDVDSDAGLAYPTTGAEAKQGPESEGESSDEELGDRSEGLGAVEQGETEEEVRAGQEEESERRTGDTTRDGHCSPDIAPSVTGEDDTITLSDLITWEKIANFSYEKMQKISRKFAPIMWLLINTYTAATDRTKASKSDGVDGRVVVHKVYRPDELVSTPSLKVARN